MLAVVVRFLFYYKGGTSEDGIGLSNSGACILIKCISQLLPSKSSTLTIFSPAPCVLFVNLLNPLGSIFIVMHIGTSSGSCDD